MQKKIMPIFFRFLQILKDILSRPLFAKNCEKVRDLFKGGGVTKTVA
jgi:hypothetical protein